MRGCDGYDKVIQVIEACKDDLPVSLMFTLTPYNNFSDMEYVVNLAKKYDIDVRIGIYNNIDFFSTNIEAHQIDRADLHSEQQKFIDMIPENVKQTAENYDFLFLYEEWLNKRLKIKCHSILDSIVIHPNGDIPICQNLDVKLGNLYENSLEYLFVPILKVILN
jgi:sulfatase maturation enzyme AslB (radical SAM superfamily)